MSVFNQNQHAVITIMQEEMKNKTLKLIKERGWKKKYIEQEN